MGMAISKDHYNNKYHFPYQLLVYLLCTLCFTIMAFVKCLILYKSPFPRVAERQSEALLDINTDLQHAGIHSSLPRSRPGG